MLAIEKLVVVPDLEAVDATQRHDLVHALDGEEVAVEPERRLAQRELLVVADLATGFVPAAHVLVRRLPQVDAKRLETERLAEPVERLRAAGHFLAAAVDFVRNVLRASPEHLDVLDALQPGSNPPREAILLAQRGEPEPVQAVEEVDAQVVPLAAYVRGGEQIVRCGGKGEARRLAADDEAVQELDVAVGGRCDWDIAQDILGPRDMERVEARNGVDDVVLVDQGTAQDFANDGPRKIAEKELLVFCHLGCRVRRWIAGVICGLVWADSSHQLVVGGRSEVEQRMQVLGAAVFFSAGYLVDSAVATRARV